MATNAQMNTALGTTNGQLTKIGEMLDARSPKVYENGDPRPNDVDDFAAHIFARYKADYVAWKNSLRTDEEF